ncbi:esterase [Mycobacterium phage Chaser]|nr:esterase [Mycobacterium phage Chaser]
MTSRYRRCTVCNMEPELAAWEQELLWRANLAAERLTRLSEPGSATSTTTPQRKAFSPPVGGGPSERREPLMLRQPEKLMLAGDWHGNLPWAFKAINYAKFQGADTILHVGDFGWWKAGPATYQYLEEVNKELDHHGINLLWVDGNHEDHAFLGSFNVPGAQPLTTKSYPRITHLPRGYRWDWWGDTWMALGGAHSVDRSFAREGESWWPGEWLDDKQMEYAMRPGKVDIIVAHDAPTNVDIPGITPGKDIWLRIDGKPRKVPNVDLLKAEEHRARIQKVCDAVKPVEFYHGHYHRDYNALCRVEGGGYMNVRGLDKDETTIAKNTYFITEGLDDE